LVDPQSLTLRSDEPRHKVYAAERPVSRPYCADGAGYSAHGYYSPGGYAQLSVIESFQEVAELLLWKIGDPHQLQRSDVITTCGLP
jgi:hypothetical protein